MAVDLAMDDLHDAASARLAKAHQSPRTTVLFRVRTYIFYVGSLDPAENSEKEGVSRPLRAAT